MTSLKGYLSSIPNDPSLDINPITKSTIGKAQEELKRLNISENYNFRDIDPNDIIHSSAVGTYFSPKPGDIKDYRRYMPVSRVFMQDRPALDETRAKNQNFWQLSVGALNQAIVGHVIGGTLEYTGYLMDIPAMAKQIYGASHEWGNNFISSIGKDIKDWTQTSTPVYQTTVAQRGGWRGLGDSTWWASLAPSIFSSASLLIPVLGTVRGLGALGKALKIGTGWTKQTKNIVDTVGAALISRHIYSTAESVDNYNQYYQRGKEVLQMTERQAIEYASKSAAHNYRLGYLNLWKDVLSWGMLLRYPDFANRAIQTKLDAAVFKRPMIGKEGLEQVAKKVVERPFRPVHLLYHGLLEGVEEYNIQWQKKEGKRRADIHTGLIEDSPYDTFLKRIVEHTKDPHTFDSFFWGTLGGVVFGALGRGVSKEMFKSSVLAEARALENLERRADFLRANLNNIITEVESGNDVGADLTRLNILTELIVSGSTQGNISIDIAMMENIAKLNAEQLAEVGLHEGASREASVLVGKLKEGADIYNQFVNKSYGFGDADAYIAANKFQMHFRRGEVNKILNNKQSELDQLQTLKTSVSGRQLSPLGQLRATVENIGNFNKIKLKQLDNELKAVNSNIEIIQNQIKDNEQREITSATLAYTLEQLYQQVEKLNTEIEINNRVGETITSDINALSEKEKLALAANEVTQEQLDTDRTIIDNSKDAEIRDLTNIVASLQNERSQLDRSINEFNNKNKQKEFVDKIQERIKKENEIRDKLIIEDIQNSTTVEQVTAINNKHDKAYTKEANARIAEIKKVETEIKAKEEAISKKPEESEGISKTKTPEKIEEVKPDPKIIPIETRDRSFAIRELNKQLDNIRAKGVEVDIDLIDAIRNALKNELNIVTDVNTENVFAIEELLEKEGYTPDLRFFAETLVSNYKIRLEQSFTDVKEVSIQDLNAKSDAIINALDKLTPDEDVTTEVKDKKFSVDIENTVTLPIIRLIQSVQDYLDTLTQHRSDRNAKVSADTVLRILRDRNDGSLETYYKQVIYSFKVLKVFEQSKQLSNVISMVDFTNLDSYLQESKFFLSYWLSKNPYIEPKTGEQFNITNYPGVYIYLHNLGKINITSKTTKLNKNQIELITALQNNLKPGDTVYLVTDPNHKDNRYSTPDEIKQRNLNPYTIPVKVVIKGEDGSLTDVGFLQELYTTHLGIKYTDKEGNFSHFTKLIIPNSVPNYRLNILHKHIKVLKDIYLGRKVTIPSGLQEIFDMLSSINKDEITTATKEQILHLITPIFYGMDVNHLDHYDIDFNRIRKGYIKHYHRFKQDFNINKSIRNEIKGKSEIEARVTHKSVPEFIRDNKVVTLDTVVKPIDLGDGNGARIIIGRTSLLNPNSKTLYDARTGKPLVIHNEGVLSKSKQHTGFYIVTEPSKGLYYAFPAWTSKLNSEVAGKKYSDLLTNYVATKIVDLLNELEQKNEVAQKSIISDLKKIIIFAGEANETYFKVNKFPNGETSVSFQTIENGIVYNDVRFNEDGNINIKKSRVYSAKGTVIKPYHKYTIKSDDIGALQELVGNMVRRININSETNAITERGFKQTGDFFIDPVNNNKYESYFDYIIQTGAIGTTLGALTDAKGNIISNFNPVGRIRSTLFINTVDSTINNENKNETLVKPSQPIKNIIKVKTLDEYIANLPEMTKYATVISEAKRLGISYEIEFAKEQIEHLDKPVNAAISTIDIKTGKFKITIYPVLPAKSTLEQSIHISHEILHSIIDYKMSRMTDDQIKILKNKINNYIEKLKEANKNNLTEEELNLLKIFIDAVDAEFTEAITYPFTSVTIASILNKIEFKTEDDTKSTFWKELYHMILEIIGVRRSSALLEIQNILNESFDVKIESETVLNNIEAYIKSTQENINELETNYIINNISYKRLSNVIGDTFTGDPNIGKAAREAGSNFDSFARQVFMGKPFEKIEYSGIESNVAKQLYKLLLDTRTEIINKGERIIAHDIVVYDQLEGVAGKVDILVITPQGKAKIYDFKTSKTPYSELYHNKKYEGNGLVRSTSDQHSIQLSGYAILFNKMTNIPVEEIGVIRFEIDYNSTGRITDIKNNQFIPHRFNNEILNYIKAEPQPINPEDARLNELEYLSIKTDYTPIRGYTPIYIEVNISDKPVIVKLPGQKITLDFGTSNFVLDTYITVYQGKYAVSDAYTGRKISDDSTTKKGAIKNAQDTINEIISREDPNATLKQVVLNTKSMVKDINDKYNYVKNHNLDRVILEPDKPQTQRKFRNTGKGNMKFSSELDVFTVDMDLQIFKFNFKDAENKPIC